MTGATKVKIKDIRLFERDTVLRMPFRFGAVTLRTAPQMFVKLEIEDAQGRRSIGYSAEILAPKWFDKNPDLSNEDNFEQLRESVRKTRSAYLASSLKTPFLLFADNYTTQLDVPIDQQLVASFGPALLDRAVVDALCRLEGISFYTAIKKNRVGISQHDITEELDGAEMARFLGQLSPSKQIAARHTVGLLDPLEKNPDPVEDGLPETLAQVAETYGNQYYKLKISGDVDADLDRLCRIVGILNRHRPDYLVSLDGNEQFTDMGSFLAFYQELRKQPELTQFLQRILFIEQPVARSAALSSEITAFDQLPPVIIDESDCSLDSFPQAMALGYRGVSSKSCKGFYKSLINLYRCKKTGSGFFLSGEDLTMQAGIAVQQDLALVSLLGLRHVERNGHHYVKGLASVERSEQKEFIRLHPDLYRDSQGVVRLDIVDGLLKISSLDCPGFASLALPDTTTMRSVQ